MKRFVPLLAICLLCFAGCKTMAVTDEPFFRYKEMQDTLDAYLARIDTSESISPSTLITYIEILDMYEVGAPVLYIGTTNESEIAIPVALEGDDNYCTYCGVYHGYLIRLSFSTKYKFLLKRKLVQSTQTKEIYYYRRQFAPKKHSDYFMGGGLGGYIVYNILSKGHLNYDSDGKYWID